jgi:hypothetical protein
MSLDGKFIRSAVGRIRRDIVPAFKEKFSTETVPCTVEQTVRAENAEKFSDSLIPSSIRLVLEKALKSMPDGTYRSREIAGSPEDGNRHVHDFIIRKDGVVVELFFIDPEHAMGKSNNTMRLPSTTITIPNPIPRVGDLRPKVNVLYAVKITAGRTVPDIALLRHRAAAIPESQQALNKPDAQLHIAEEMLISGLSPSFLAGKESEITFRLDMRQKEHDTYSIIGTAREASSTKDLTDMIQGELPKSHPIEGQLERFRSIMRTHFPAHMRRGTFKLIDSK